MRRSAAVACLLLAATYGTAQLVVTPTTTLSAETANNTSAAASFVTQMNGNIGASNISKVDTRALLYAGSTTRIYANLVLWFGQSNHMNIGYSSTDPAQVKRQVTDMISRGFQGVVVAWYGPNNFVDQATKVLMAEAEAHPGFNFAIMVDHGAILWDSCAGCNPQQALTQQLQYVAQTYFVSPAYLRIGGRPVITDFDIDLFYTIDWAALAGVVTGNPLFLFENANGFTHTVSGGSYAWVMPTTTDYGMSYLTSFYDAGLAVPSEQTMGAAYKGFNDTLASWTLNRIMGQQCGATWLQTFDKINSLYSSSKQLDGLQLVTWNDYEEGTEIETGIDNCASVSAAMVGNSVSWNLSGNQNTIDRFSVYISTDGQQLMRLTDTAAGSRSVDLCVYNPQGSYTLYVQAVGRPGLTNKMSGAVAYTAQCPTFKVAATPSSLIVGRGQSVNSQISVSAQGSSFNGRIALSCSNIPAGAVCSFAPPTLVPGAGTVTSTLTISVAAASAAKGSHRRREAPTYAFLVPGFGVASIAMIGPLGARRRYLLSLLLLATLVLTSCGGASGTARAQQSLAQTSTGTFVIAVVGTSGSQQSSAAATLTIQ